MSEEIESKPTKLKDTAWAISSIVVAILSLIFAILSLFAENVISGILGIQTTQTPSEILTPTFSPSDEEVTFDLIYSTDQLVLIFPGNQSVSIEGLAFEAVVSSTEIARVSFLPETFPAFSALNLSNLPVPLCLVIRIQDRDTSIPQECENITVLVQNISAIDQFWLEPQSQSLRSIRILRHEAIVGQCIPSMQRCNITYSLEENYKVYPFVKTENWSIYQWIVLLSRNRFEQVFGSRVLDVNADNYRSQDSHQVLALPHAVRRTPSNRPPHI